MPLFFFISGLVLKIDGFAVSGLYKPLIRLLYPWIFWTLFISNFNTMPPNELNSPRALFYAYWFFPVLISHLLIYYSAARLHAYVKNLTLSILITASFVLLILRYIDIYLYDLSKFHLIFFVIGLYAKSLYLSVGAHHKLLNARLSALLLLSFAFFLFLISDLEINKSITRILFSVPLILALGAIFYSGSFEGAGWLEILGRYSLEIYVTHVAVIFLFNSALNFPAMPPILNFLISTLLLSLITFIIIYAIRVLGLKFYIYGR